MGNAKQSRMEAVQQAVDTMRQSSLLNDTFVSIALEDVKACQHVLQTIMGRKDFEVIEAKGQYRLLNPTAKDSILDILAEDDSGRLMNVEIQRKDTVDHARRTRYYGSMLDKSILEKGKDYDQFPDVYVIYISETDIWETEEAVSFVKKTLGKKAIPYDDGRHVIYVNAAVDDGSEAAKMMKYFKTADPEDQSQGDLSRRVRFLKKEQGGYQTMCEAAEKLVKWGIEEGEINKARKLAIKMYQNGSKPEEIAEFLETNIEQVKDWLGL